ncbi:MAG: ribosome biogenesis GTPase Der, partial [Coxiellaceae bacterium]|nr:ribosome biogenesis GTPase Der [Coxiellaceae bacterium]
MLPVIAIVGRPNVGKSTLFNLLTQSRDALVVDVPGVTRDRQYGEGKLGGRPYFVVDTGGIAEPDDPEMAKVTDDQVWAAIDEADVLFFMVDAKAGLVPSDEVIAERLRRYQKKIVLLVNKADRDSGALVCSEFHALGFGEPLAVSAKQGRGVAELIQATLSGFPEVAPPPKEEGIRIAVVGRPNVGKSTLINRMLGEDRLVVFDRPGTTRDTIEVSHERREQKYILIDTAGIRRSRKITDTVERFSILKSMQAMKAAHVVIVVINAQEGLGEQDMRLLGMVAALGKALVIAFNKWDGMDEYARDRFKEAVERKLQFVDYSRRYTISALHGTGVGKLYHAIHEAYESAVKEISTSQLTTALEKAIGSHQPPLVKGRRIKLRYAHIGGHDPLMI